MSLVHAFVGLKQRWFAHGGTTIIEKWASHPMTATDAIETLTWIGDTSGYLSVIDQTRLPLELVHVPCRDVKTVWEAIRSLRVRGAPAIGIAAAYGVCLGMQDDDGSQPERQLEAVIDYLGSSRPTAVNLFWALERMRRRFQTESPASRHHLLDRLLDEARAIHREDREVCHAIGKHGVQLIEDGYGVLTHCNAGGLATAEYGTALSVVFTAQDMGKQLHVFVDETRPLLQGARLTAWELCQRGIETTLICDSMAAQVMKEGRIQAVLTGADRVAANGDSANKIGTYSVAVLARAHNIPFYIAAPISTFDMTIGSGSEIPIEQRSASEVTNGFGRQTAPENVSVYNPAFDVTPAELISAIITERGVIQPVGTAAIAAMLSGGD